MRWPSRSAMPIIAATRRAVARSGSAAMIAKLTGLLDSVGTRSAASSMCGGVGYLVFCSARRCAVSAMSGPPCAPLETQVREDAIALFGFVDCRSATGSAG